MCVGGKVMQAKVGLYAVGVKDGVLMLLHARSDDSDERLVEHARDKIACRCEAVVVCA